ncbi:MAG TPA: redoxin family protein [Pirellulales bacterium]|nr:redoxin family protein [Pirellulales bacterium]
MYFGQRIHTSSNRLAHRLKEIRIPGRRVMVPAWCCAQVIGFVFGAGLTYAAFDLFSLYVPPLSSVAAPSLSCGERPMPLKAAGWLNGEPPPWSKLTGKVVVLDFWIDWCPYCHSMASYLVPIKRHFEKEGVVFISLTPDNEDVVRQFAAQYGIDWHMGWGAGEIVERYLGKDFSVLIVIGRDGRVVWNDGGARLQHRTDDAAPELFDQIKKAL